MTADPRPEPIRAGHLLVSYDLLAQLLRLPASHQIIAVADTETARVWLRDLATRTATLIVTGPDMPLVREGETVPWVALTVRNDGHAEWT